VVCLKKCLTGETVLEMDVKRPTLFCDLRRVVCSQSAVWRLLAQVSLTTSQNRTSGQSPGRRTRRSAVAQDYLRDGGFTTVIP
jgi:hypothetical protein